MKNIIFTAFLLTSISAYPTNQDNGTYTPREVAVSAVVSGGVGYAFGKGYVSRYLVAPLVLPVLILTTGQGVCGMAPVVCQCRQKAIVSVLTTALAVTIVAFIAVRTAILSG